MRQPYGSAESDAMKAKQEEKERTALILTAGAPHSPLIAGALYALCEEGKTFDVIYTSGAGTLIGLLYSAPKGRGPKEALKSIVEMGVSDAIYRLLPIGYKTFFKPGPFTQPIHRLAQRFKLGTFPLGPLPHPNTRFGRAYNEWAEAWLNIADGAFKRFYNDLVDMWASVITPTTLNYWSKGVCQPLPFLEDLVDFEKLKDFPVHFYMNALCIPETLRNLRTLKDPTRTGLTVKLFEGHEITPSHVRAAFAYPFIYPPVTIKGDLYFDGAFWEPISFGNLLTHERLPKGMKTIVLIDILASLDRYLLREPRNLWDAYGMSIVAPVVAHAKREVARFRGQLRKDKIAALNRQPHARLAQFNFFEMQFEIPDSLAPHMTDWSYSNMSRLFQIGYEKGKSFWPVHMPKLSKDPR